jgi:hypothetical protein
MHTLANRRNTVVLSPGGNGLDMGELLEGDANNDNAVDAADASLINAAFGSSVGGPTWDPRADFNEDSVVNGVDMNLLAANYNQTGDVVLGASALASATSRASLAAPRTNLAATVDLGFEPNTFTVEPGDTITMDVKMYAGSQDVDTVDLQIFYPATNLQLVDEAGDPVTMVEVDPALDMVLENEVNAAEGAISVVATMLGDTLSGEATLATLRFRALAPSSAARVLFSAWDPPTDLLYEGQSVFGDWSSATVTITGGYSMYLPLMLKP